MSKVKRLFGITSFGLVGLLLLVIVVGVVTAYDTKVGAPVRVDAVVGSSFTLPVTVTNVTNLYAFQFRIQFDPQVITVTSAANGGFLTGACGSTLACITQMGPNYVDYTVSYLTPGSSNSGSGNLANLTFQPLRPGANNLSFTFSGLSDSSGNPILHDPLDGQIIVLGQVSFSSAAYSVGEGAGPAVITASLAQTSTTPITVTYGTSNGTALAGSDYTAATGQVVFAPGDSTQTFNVPITNDTLDEANETVNLTLSSPVNAQLVSPSAAVLTITDDDPLPDVAFDAATQTVPENAGTVVVTATLSTASGRDVTVPFTVSGTATGGGVDHNLANGSITILAGSLNGTTSFAVTNDALDEADETVVVTMGTPTNATAVAPTTKTITIQDDDPLPNVAFDAATQTVPENAGTVVVTATLSAASGLNVTVPFTVSGTATGGGVDHNLANGSITILAGSLNGTTSFAVTNDALDEADETVVVTMGTPTNATAVAPTTKTITIQDDDVAGISVTPTSGLTTGENGITATFTIVLNSQPTANVTIALSTSDSTEGTVAPVSVTFTPANWNVPQMVVVTGVNDAVRDGDVVYTIVTAAATSTDASYTGLNPADVSVTNLDDERMIYLPLIARH